MRVHSWTSEYLDSERCRVLIVGGESWPVSGGKFIDDTNEVEVDLRFCMKTGMVPGLLVVLALLLGTSSESRDWNLIR